jgi:outer membrane protein, heavy metal efflux system
MASNKYLLTQLAGVMLLLAALMMQANAQQQNMQNIPGMQMPANQSTPPAAPEPQMQNMPGMKMPMDYGQHEHDMKGMQKSPDKPGMKEDIQDLPAGPALKLDDLEQMALSRNPTFSLVNANVRAAAGMKKQAGLYPNPTVGYYGDEIRGGAFRSGKEGAFINQTIVLGGKLGAARRTAEQQQLQAVTNVEAQRYRVLSSVQSLYYEVLAAQRLVQVRRQLLSLASDAVETSHQLGNVGQADRPDVLQAEVEAEQEGLALASAKQNYQSLWQTMAAMAGNPELPLSRLDGNLEDVPQLDLQEWLTKMLNSSPQVKYAQEDVDRAKAVLREAKKVPIPDLQISANVSQDNEPLEPLFKRTGIVGGAQVGVQLPIFNRNQGSVEKAKADLERSQAEIQRVQLDLRRQVSTLFRNYTTARITADCYRDSMLPRAQKAYELYKANYQNMAAAYPQVLIAQRTLFQLQVDYIHALETIWMNALQIQGYGLSDGLAAPPTLGGGSSTISSGPVTGSLQ